MLFEFRNRESGGTPPLRPLYVHLDAPAVELRAATGVPALLVLARRHLLMGWCAVTGERVLATPNNPISLGMTLDSLARSGTPEAPRLASDADPSGSADGGPEGQPSVAAPDPAASTYFGSMLFNRCA